MQTYQPRLFDLARLKQQIDADSEVPLRELHKRDSGIARLITAQKAIPRLLGWLEQLAPEGSADHHPEGFIIFWLVVIGLVAGVLSMSGVLFASQQQPVNILLFLALFVGVQLLLLLVTVVSAFFPFEQKRLASPLSLLNPAALLLKRSLGKLSSTMPWDSMPRLTRFALLRWSQVLGIAFNLALLGTLVVVLAISDRSFGWSSTLDISSSTLLQVLETISIPWSRVTDSARVSAELIELTRFQSLQNQFDGIQVEAMRRWWPFLFAAIVCYGLLPRLLLMIVFHTLLKRGIRQTFLNYPGTALVLDRLATPFVSTHEPSAEYHQADTAAPNTQSPLPRGLEFNLVNWTGAMDRADSQLSRLGIQAGSIIDAGFDLHEDKAVVESLRQQAGPLMVAVKSWEPPLAELADFLGAINNGGQIYLLMMPLQQRPISANELSDWQHFVQGLAFPVLLVRGDAADVDSSPEPQ